MPALPADYVWKALHHLNTRHVLGVLTRHHWQQSLHNRQEEHSHAQRHDLGQKLQRPCELELLFRKRVTHINDIQNDQYDYEDEQVKHHQEGCESHSGNKLAESQVSEYTRKCTQSLTTIPYWQNRVVKRKGHHLEVVDSGLKTQSQNGLILAVVRLVEQYE